MSGTSYSIRLALAEDHRLVREGLKALLRDDPSFEVVAEAADGLQAVEVVQKIKPDVLLLDLRLPRLHGLDVLRQLRDQKHTRILIVSMHADEISVVETLKAGAAGYIIKDSALSELAEAIRTVAKGGQYLAEALRQKTMTATLRRIIPGVRGPQITQREFMVLEHAAEGKTSAEIAEKLSISRRTAEAHRASLMKKLNLKTQTDLVHYALRSGLTTL